MAREVENPVVINLSELPEEGRQLNFNQESGELTESLQDTIGTNPYAVNLSIAPLGNAFSVTGNIKAGMGLICSKCAVDFIHPVKETVDEIFVVVSKLPRTSKSARVNNITELDESGPECTEIDSPMLHLGEFVREIIILAEPIKPLGRPDCDKTCPNLQEAIKGGWAPENFAPDQDELGPFAALKDLKLNN